jgi:AsmA protein
MIKIRKSIIKTLKITGVISLIILFLMLIIPMLFSKAISGNMQRFVNNNINGKVSLSGTNLSFFDHFPDLTLTLKDVSLNGSAPFVNDTLLYAKDASFALDLTSLFTKIKVSKLYLSQAFINIKVDSAGHANYNVYKNNSGSHKGKGDTAGTSLGIDEILLEKSHLLYNDHSLPMLINARNFNYQGSGDLTKDVFDLHTHIEVGSVDFYYANQAYVLNKKVNADLVTSINTKSLAFIFQKNDLLINDLPVEFKGRFGFLKDGYDMDFQISSHQSDLSDIFTAMPAAIAKWGENTEINGTGNIQMSLIGKYIVSKNVKPDINFSMNVKDGYVASKNTPSPVKNLYLSMNAKVPGLNPDSLSFNIDSVHFNIDKDYFTSSLKIRGLTSPYIYAKVNTEIDLQKWSKAFGIKPFQVKGRYALHLLAQGKYTTAVQKKGLRHLDTIITSIPQFTLQSSFTNGYLKYTKLPQAIEKISFNLDANCPDNNVKHASLHINDISITALNNYIKGYFNASNQSGVLIDAGLKMKFHLNDIKNIYPIDSLDIRGDILADIQTKGKYIPARKIFPVTKAEVNLKDGYIQTKYYPRPLKNIQVSTNITNNTGSLKGLRVKIKPISFNFEGQPFIVKADLKNFENLEYRMSAQGTMDIGKIYKVFALNGYDVKGLVTTNFSLKGKQSDAVAGHYDQLMNAGTMQVKNLALTSDLFPKPFVIKTGFFSFNQDKMKFDSFIANYGRSTIILDGALSNVIDYAVKPGSALKGDFNLKSDLIIADDFMAFASGPGDKKSKAATKPTGVILIPTNLDLNFTADVKKVKYNGLDINDAKGQMAINNGQLFLKQAGFNLAGANVTMDAAYKSITPNQAYFDYHIHAKDFDIQRAYREVKLFHDMASCAASAQGIVSLDYKLSGKLNSDMKPVYPSLKGGGVFSIKNVKVKEFKLFSAVGQTTGHDSLSKSGDLSKVDIKSTIANNIITIERTKMRFAGFRPRFEGQVSLNGMLNLKFRLGLPPFGIFGIPMTITGTQANPKIHTGNGKKEDELEEEKDDSNE